MRQLCRRVEPGFGGDRAPIGDGHERWRDDAGAGTDPAGVDLHVRGLDVGGKPYAAYLKEGSTPYAELAAVDAVSGGHVTVSASAGNATLPTACKDAFCCRGSLPESPDLSQSYRVSVDGRVEASAAVAPAFSAAVVAMVAIDGGDGWAVAPPRPDSWPSPSERRMRLVVGRPGGETDEPS